MPVGATKRDPKCARTRSLGRPVWVNHPVDIMHTRDITEKPNVEIWALKDGQHDVCGCTSIHSADAAQTHSADALRYRQRYRQQYRNTIAEHPHTWAADCPILHRLLRCVVPVQLLQGGCLVTWPCIIGASTLAVPVSRFAEKERCPTSEFSYRDRLLRQVAKPVVYGTVQYGGSGRRRRNTHILSHAPFFIRVLPS